MSAQDEPAPELETETPDFSEAEAMIDDGLEAVAAVESAPANALADIPTAELLEQITGPLFGVLAPGWGVKPEEVKTLSESWAAVLDKYFPDIGSEWGPELAAGLVTVAVIGPRLALPRKPAEIEQSPGPEQDREPEQP